MKARRKAFDGYFLLLQDDPRWPMFLHIRGLARVQRS